jgi:formate dehydrogenase maturation protein FdhE
MDRLKKLIQQDKLKAVLEYAAKQWEEQQKSASTTAKPAQSKKAKERKKSEQVKDKIKILHFDSSGDFKGRQIT